MTQIWSFVYRVLNWPGLPKSLLNYSGPNHYGDTVHDIKVLFWIGFWLRLCLFEQLVPYFPEKKQGKRLIFCEVKLCETYSRELGGIFFMWVRLWLRLTQEKTGLRRQFFCVCSVYEKWHFAPTNCYKEFHWHSVTIRNSTSSQLHNWVIELLTHEVFALDPKYLKGFQIYSTCRCGWEEFWAKGKIWQYHPHGFNSVWRRKQTSGEHPQETKTCTHRHFRVLGHWNKLMIKLGVSVVYNEFVAYFFHSLMWGISKWDKV